MDLSGEVAEVHMRTDAKNLATTARTIQEVFMILLTFQLTIVWQIV